MCDKRTMQVQIKNGDTVVGSFSPGDERSYTLTIELLEPKLPDRNPLHKYALKFEDIKPDLVIQRHYIDCGSTKTAIVIGKPFRYDTKYPPDAVLGRAWMVPVVVTSSLRKLVRDSWFLTDMGVMPYERPGSVSYWNRTNYTLAAE